MATTPATSSTVEPDVDEVRDLVTLALKRYAATGPSVTPSERALLEAMAANPTGWTHTTRLREFLAGVMR